MGVCFLIFCHICPLKYPMTYLELLIIAFGLSMDSFTISIADGLLMPELKFRPAIFIAGVIGVFHIIMTIGGYFLASIIEDDIKYLDHWIAFSLLAFIGIKMIYESIQNKDKKGKENQIALSHTQIIMQAVATSIDALAIGITFAFLSINIYQSAVLIGFVCFFMVMVGLKAGKSIGVKLGSKLEIVAGSLLFLIGLKILMEHLFFG